MRTIKLITAPASEPISLSEAKLHLRVDGTDDDALITGMITAARRSAEARIDRALVTQTWELALDEWDDEILLPMAPVQSITSIKYIDTAGVEQTLASANYSLYNNSILGHLVTPAYGVTYPTARTQREAIKIRYVAGYGAAADVPQDIKSWMYLAIGTMYANRESVAQYSGAMSPLPGKFWESLLEPYYSY